MSYFDDIRAWVESRIFGIVQYGKVTRSKSDGADGSDGAATGGPQNMRRMFPWGLRSVPPVGSESVQVCPGGHPGNAVEIAAESTKRSSSGLEYSYGPKDLAEGETALYDKAGSVIRQSQDGTTKIDAASGKDVIVNGGSHAVVTINDSVNCGSIMALVAGAPPAVAVTLSYVDPGGNVIPWFAFTATAGTPGTYSLPITGAIHPGSPHFKA